MPRVGGAGFGRGALHALGTSLWFFALPHLALADTTAIGFTGPIFSMIGAAYLLGEKMRWDRWVAALVGFTGVLIVVGPVDPALDRLYIGRTFCVVVLAGLGSMSGTLAAGLILGIAESIVLMVLGTSWAPAVSFGLLLLVLGIRPQGLFGR